MKKLLLLLLFIKKDKHQNINKKYNFDYRVQEFLLLPNSPRISHYDFYNLNNICPKIYLTNAYNAYSLLQIQMKRTEIFAWSCCCSLDAQCIA